MKLGHLSVGRDAPPFIIAEMSGNHNQSLDTALKIVDAAAACGAHALKLQTYTADTITLDVHDGEFRIEDAKSLWNKQSLYDLYQQAHTPWEWHKAIFERARALGLVCFSTPFDETAVDFLDELGAPCYKIASFENIHLPLIRKAAATGKPLIMSTGMATLAELDEAVRAAREAGCRDLVLLKCTSNYPAEPTDANLATLPHLRQLFDCEVGLSDHTTGLGVSVASVALGASVIERHFVLDRSAGGVDSAFSLEPAEMAALVAESKRAWQALGKISYGPTQNEERSLQFRRSLYVARDMEAGEAFDTTSLRCVRPGLGLAPKHFDMLLGRKVRKAVKKGTPLSWELLLD